MRLLPATSLPRTLRLPLFTKSLAAQVPEDESGYLKAVLVGSWKIPCQLIRGEAKMN